MITTARQLKDLVRNLSNKKSADAQILMRNYMMENNSKSKFYGMHLWQLQENVEHWSR